MGVKGGPQIIDDGLVFYLDAAGANKVYDTQGLNIEYLIVGGGGGGAGYSTAPGGGAGGFLLSSTKLSSGTYNILVGAGDYLDLETDITISPTNQGWTCIYWFKTNSASTLQHFNSAEADDFNAKWYQAVFVCDSGGTNYRYYINGQREGGDHVNNVWASAYSALKTRYIGRYEYDGAYSRYFNGNIAITKMHDRALSDTEIRKNFNALKGRFGL